MITAKIVGISFVKDGKIVADLDNNKKLYLDRPTIETATLLGVSIKTGSQVMVKDSTNPVTGEVSPTWAALAM